MHKMFVEECASCGLLITYEWENSPGSAHPFVCAPENYFLKDDMRVRGTDIVSLLAADGIPIHSIAGIAMYDPSDPETRTIVHPSALNPEDTIKTTDGRVHCVLTACAHAHISSANVKLHLSSEGELTFGNPHGHMCIRVFDEKLGGFKTLKNSKINSPFLGTMYFHIVSTVGDEKSALEEDYVVVENDDCEDSVLVDVHRLRETVSESSRVSQERLWHQFSVSHAPPPWKGRWKKVLRSGIHGSLRRRVWRALCSVDDTEETSAAYSRALIEASPLPENDNVPNFGGVLRFDQHALTPAGICAAKRVLCVLADDLPHISFCPPLPDLVSMFLLYLTEAETFVAAETLLLHEKQWYFKPGKVARVVTLRTFVSLLETKIPQFYTFLKEKGFLDEQGDIFAPWFDRMFFSQLPLTLGLLIFDTFLNEGIKVLHRFGLALLVSCMNKLMEERMSFHSFQQFIIGECGFVLPQEVILKKAFRIRLRRDIIATLDRMNREAIDPVSLLRSPQVRVVARVPRDPLDTVILDQRQYHTLWGYLPSRLWIRKPELVFNTRDDGYSLLTFYHKCSQIREHILVVEAYSVGADGLVLKESKKGKKSETAVFGALLSNGWHVGRGYYGNGNMIFLFTFGPKARKYEWIGKPRFSYDNRADVSQVGVDDLDVEEEEDALTADDTSVKELSMYFQLAQTEGITIGGGGDGAGLYIDKDLYMGSSKRSGTFGNEPLCNGAENFQVINMEVFEFV